MTHIFRINSGNNAAVNGAGCLGLCVTGPGVRKRSKTVKEVKKKPKPKKTKSKSGQSGKKKKASSVCDVFLVRAGSSSTLL